MKYIKVYYSANLFILAFITFLIFRPIKGQINSIQSYNYNDYTRVSGITYEASSNVDPEAKENSSSNSGYSSNGGAGNLQGVIDYVYSKLGCPYVWSATGPDSFDCSGLCVAAYKDALGIDLPRSTYGMLAVAGYSAYPGDDKIKPGDLLFPHDGHVVMYVGNSKIIHAPQTGDVVKEVDLNSKSYKYWWRPTS